MKIIGIICEYNPFHNGHIYHIEKIRKLYKDCIIILVLNGYFLERGEISILDKKTKANIALNNGVDVILELPFVYGSQSADKFANAALKILNNFKVDKIVFGSECNNLDILNKIVETQLYDNNYNQKVKEYLDKGLNYPTAMSKALNINFDFNNPNDLLGISYIKAIKQNNFDIEPIVIKRTSSYHDLKSNEKIISASNIRNKLKKNESINNYLPQESINNINNIDYDKYFEILKYKIITEHNLAKYLTVDEGIENKLKKVILEVDNVENLLKKLKTKRYTYNKLNRMLVHILVGLLKEDNNIPIDYIHVLGFNDKGKKYLNSIKKELVVPIKVNHDSKIFKYELKASLIYEMLTTSSSYEFELKNKPILK